MYRRTLTKPRKWNEESLALATKEELVADLLLRKAQLPDRKTSMMPWDRHILKRKMHWISVVNRELEQRQEWIMES